MKRPTKTMFIMELATPHEAVRYPRRVSAGNPCGEHQPFSAGCFAAFAAAFAS